MTKRYLEVNIAAITYSHTSEYGVGCIRAFFRNMRENCPPIGVGDIVEGSRDFYCRRICEEFGGKKYEAASDGAVRVLRKALVNNERSVICAIGPMTNIAALLKSAPDDISELDGVRLVEQKCDRIIMMAGDFSYLGGGEKHAEWNVKCDVSAMQTVLQLSKAPLVFVPYELGVNMITGKPAVSKYGERSVLSLAFESFGANNGRHSWDPATVLYAVEGCGEFFDESESCRVTVDDEGVSYASFGEGRHKILSMRDCADINKIKLSCAEYIDSAIMNILKESVKI